MSIIKRADIKGKMVVSETLLKCPVCGHRDVGKPRKCLSCGARMEVSRDNQQS